MEHLYLEDLHVDSEILDITPSRSKPNQAIVLVRSTMLKSERRTGICSRRKAAGVQTRVSFWVSEKGLLSHETNDLFFRCTACFLRV
jgi:hypothetical protein